MAIGHSASVVASDLVFYYDMLNPKSWLGAPTTNRCSANTIHTNWNNSGTATWTNDDPYIPRLYPDIITMSMTKDTAGNSHIAHGYATLVANTVYTVSTHVYIPSNTTTLASSQPYIRPFPGNFNAANLEYNGSSDWNIWPRDRWIRISKTFTNSATDTEMYISCYLDNAGSKIAFTAPMVEANSFATPYTPVSTSRSNTQVITDLMNRRTITATSLTYSSNNTFSFNGSTNNIVTNTFTSTLDFTISIWVRMTSSLVAQQRLVSSDSAGTFTIYWSGSDFGFHYNPLDASPPSTATAATGLSYSINSWYNLTATNNATAGTRFYVNGVLRAVGETSVPLAGNITFGSDRTNSLHAAAQIPVAMIYNRVLTADEVNKNFNALRGRYSV